MNSSRLSKLSGALRHYRFIDYATQGYVLGMGLLVLVLHNDSVGFWPGLVAAHLLCVVLVHLLIRTHAARPPGRLLDILRHFYPVILYTALYRETGTLNQMLFSGYLDAFFMSLEERVFGMQPAVQFMERLPYLPVSELFYASYFSYYIMIVGIGAALYFRDKRQFFHYVSLASFSFYACFFIYILLPVIGPRVFFDSECAMKLAGGVRPANAILAYPAAVQAGLFFRIMKIIYRHFEASGAAVPSSHVVVAICTCYFSRIYLPRIHLAHFTLVVLLCLSTIYCRYHYVVDIMAGVLVVAALIPLGNWLYHKFPGSTSSRAGPA